MTLLDETSPKDFQGKIFLYADGQALFGTEVQDGGSNKTKRRIMLANSRIAHAVCKGQISVLPEFCPELLGPNSLDVRLGRFLKLYDENTDDYTKLYDILEQGPYNLLPGDSVLGHTFERIRTFAPLLAVMHGKSTLGRMFVQPHATAGLGDAGFDGEWTLEITNIGKKKGFFLNHKMEIAQLSFHKTWGPVFGAYEKATGHRYHNQTGPQESRPSPGARYADPRILQILEKGNYPR